MDVPRYQTPSFPPHSRFSERRPLFRYGSELHSPWLLCAGAGVGPTRARMLSRMPEFAASDLLRTSVDRLVNAGLEIVDVVQLSSLPLPVPARRSRALLRPRSEIPQPTSPGREHPVLHLGRGNLCRRHVVHHRGELRTGMPGAVNTRES